MGLPAPLKLKLYRGDTRVWTSTFTDDATGDPLDLTGHVWLCEVRADRSRGEVLATLEVDTTEAVTGVIRRTLTAEQADLLPPTDPTDPESFYWWDLQSTKDGHVQTWLAGKVTVEGDASDA